MSYLSELLAKYRNAPAPDIGLINAGVRDHNESAEAHLDIRTELSGKVNNSQVLTDVPVDAEFTDTVYTHPESHPASMITGLPESLPASGGDADTVGGFTVGVNVPAGAKFTDTVYTHPTTAGNKHIPTGGSANQILKYSASGTAVWEAENDTITTINGKTGAIAKEDIVALGIPATDTDTTYTEITIAEIDAGTASTLRTITGRRVKYILDKVQGWIGGLTKSDVGLSNVTNDKQMPISGGVLENYREKLVTLSGTSTTINLLLGNVFTHTLSGDTTYTISNAVSGQAHSFTLIINQPATPVTLTFPASVEWQGGEIPDLSTANKTYVLTFMTVDGGTTWLGMFGGEF